MKFGRAFLSRQVPEWSASYIDYDALKADIKRANSDTDFPSVLQSNIAKIERFYNERQKAISTALSALYHRYGMESKCSDSALPGNLDQTERGDITESLSELCQIARKLIWYGKVNHHGVQKLLRKLNSRMRCMDKQPFFDMINQLSAYNFAHQCTTLENLRSMENLLEQIRRLPKTCEPSSQISLLVGGLFSNVGLSSNLAAIVQSGIRSDNKRELTSALENIEQIKPRLTSALPFVLALVQFAIAWDAQDCIIALLSRLEFIETPTSLGTPTTKYMDYIHRFVIQAGRKAQANGLATSSEKLLINALKATPAYLRPYALQKDAVGRSPLHYAAAFGLQDLSLILMGVPLTSISQRQDYQVSESNIMAADAYYQTAVEIAIAGKFSDLARLILERFWEIGNKRKLSELLRVLVLYNQPKLLNDLLTLQGAKDFLQGYMERALYGASQRGYTECAKMLLSLRTEFKVDAEQEPSTGWTPLMIACIHGHLPIVELLVDADADTHKQDTCGWTSVDHAAFRGNFRIVEYLRTFGRSCPPPSDVDPARRGLVKTNGTHQPIALPPTHGKLEPSDADQIFIVLGTHNSKKGIKAVYFNSSDEHAHESMYGDIDYFVKISAVGEPDICHHIDLPILEDKINSPLRLESTKSNEPKVMFKLYRATNLSKRAGTVIASGVALLGDSNRTLQSSNESLVRDCVVPLVGADGVEYFGKLTFHYLVVRPFKCSGPLLKPNFAAWRLSGPSQVIGHRGSGRNTSQRKYIQIGENTLQSFQYAIECGASYVEFDVQVTKDGVPVIYHDFIVNETGTDAPMHMISNDQFNHIVNTQTQARYGLTAHSPMQRKSQRSLSLDAYSDLPPIELLERMKHTIGFNGIKGNNRTGDCINSPFTTLQEMLDDVPTHAGFNIEIKYPMLFEMEDLSMDFHAMEINLFVDTILTTLSKCGRGRPIVLSSFSPEICIALSTKQRSIPVYFLNDAGNTPTGDVRASSLQEAVHFAKAWGLAGVVMASEPFVISPKPLIGYVKNKGLKCLSYGDQNNDVENAKAQIDAGLDAIIVDRVSLVYKGLSRSAIQ